MKYVFGLCVLLAVGCEDTPPSGSHTLSAPTQPVFLRSGSTELLAFIDQGHDAVRVLDLTVGTYQWGQNPYFPREAAIAGSPIDLRMQGSDLVALSASGEAYVVPPLSGVPIALGLAAPVGGAHALGLVEHAAGLARLDSDCSAINLSDGAGFAALEMGQCRPLGAGLFAGTNGTGEQVLQLGDGVVEILSAAPFAARAARRATGGGYWILSADLRRLARCHWVVAAVETSDSPPSPETMDLRHSLGHRRRYRPMPTVLHVYRCRPQYLRARDDPPPRCCPPHRQW